MLDGGVFAAINTTFKFVEFCYALRDVPEESLVFILLIKRVRDDLDECIRLCCIPAIRDHLELDASQKEYIYGTIDSTRVALAGIGRYVESVRTEEEKHGEISLHTRFEWILRHQYKLQSRQAGLGTCHKSLLQAMSRLTLFLHAATLTGGQNGLPSYGEATNEKGGVMDAQRVDANVVEPTITEPDDELDGFLTTRNRRMRTGRGKNRSESTTNIPIPANTEWSPAFQSPERPFAPPLEPRSRCLSPEAIPDWTRSHLHPNATGLGYDTARPSTAASNMTGSTCLDEPVTASRFRSFSTSSSQASTAYTISSEPKSPDANASSFLSGPPTPFFPPERPRSSSSTYPPQHQVSSSARELEQFGMRPQSFTLAPPYQTHHANFSVGSGISDFSLRTPTYSTHHQNFSAVSGFSELPAQSPRQARSHSNLAPNPTQFYPWNDDPGANAPEVVPPSKITTSTYMAYSPRGPPEQMPDYSLPQVVPVEHERHVESLPEVVTRCTGSAYLYPTRPLGAGLENVPHAQAPLQQKSMTQAQERREKNRARLNLIAGD